MVSIKIDCVRCWGASEANQTRGVVARVESKVLTLAGPGVAGISASDVTVTTTVCVTYTGVKKVWVIG